MDFYFVVDIYKSYEQLMITIKSMYKYLHSADRQFPVSLLAVVGVRSRRTRGRRLVVRRVRTRSWSRSWGRSCRRRAVLRAGLCWVAAVVSWLAVLTMVRSTWSTWSTWSPGSRTTRTSRTARSTRSSGTPLSGWRWSCVRRLGWRILAVLTRRVLAGVGRGVTGVLSSCWGSSRSSRVHWRGGRRPDSCWSCCCRCRVTRGTSRTSSRRTLTSGLASSVDDRSGGGGNVRHGLVLGLLLLLPAVLVVLLVVPGLGGAGAGTVRPLLHLLHGLEDLPGVHRVGRARG